MGIVTIVTEVPAPVVQPIRALRDSLSVEFTPTPQGAKNVSLIGPATFVATVITP